MFGYTLSKFLIKSVIAFAITLVLIIIGLNDKSNAEIRNFDFAAYFEKFDSEKPDNLPVYDFPDTIKEYKDDVAKSTHDEVIIEKQEETFDLDSKLFSLSGTSSHYADKFHGRLTASGETFNMHDYTCANKELPFGTILKITNLDNGLTTLVKVNDRGPYVNDRIIDLSYAAAKRIGNLGLPKIKAESFDKNYSVNKDTHFFGFSEDSDLITIKKSSVEVLGETKDWSEAISLYRSMKEKSNMNNTYIFTNADKKYYKKTTYRIGIVEAEELFAANY
jgi:rare lipoprotein A